MGINYMIKILFLFSDKNFFNLAFDYVIFVEVSDSHKIELFLFSILLFSKKKKHNLERFKSDFSNEVPVLNWKFFPFFA
jgi:hypothetical protein